MSRVVLRPAERADFDALLGEPLPHRVRAIAAEIDGRLLGVGGLAFLPDGTVGAFVHANDEARKYKVAMHRAGLAAIQMAREAGIRRMVAMADPNIEAAEPWLERLGFKEMTVDNARVWVWQP
jgi:N-acetylglutamate synthase-like GNAT family acetyltransferase